MKQSIREIVSAALRALSAQSGWPCDLDLESYALEEPRDPAFGQLAANCAMILAKRVGERPRDLAQRIIGAVDDPEGLIESMDVAGPGFINFRLAKGFWAKILASIRAQGPDYGRKPPTGRKVQVEFVSANPTGPLHVGHGRGAALGDAAARLLAFQGHEVEREYYINDAGRQMGILGISVLTRMEERAGLSPELPEDFYKGGYIFDLAD